MSGPPTYDRLVAEVHGRAASADAADLLEAAVQASAEHATTADRLLDHFVAHARGNGMSDRDPPSITFDDFVGDLAAVFDAAGVERAPILGISQGAAVPA